MWCKGGGRRTFLPSNEAKEIVSQDFSWRPLIDKFARSRGEDQMIFRSRDAPPNHSTFYEIKLDSLTPWLCVSDLVWLNPALSQF